MQTRFRKPARDLKKGDVLARGGTVNNVTKTKRGKTQVWIGTGHPLTMDPHENVWTLQPLNEPIAHEPTTT